MTDFNEKIKQIIQENSGKGEIRVNCINLDCEGNQKNTLSINTETGVYNCHRCGIKGNALKSGYSDNSEKSAQEKAIGMLNNSYSVNSFPYLETKRVKAYEGIRGYEFKSNGERVILIPVMNCHNETLSLQIIKENGDKQFLKGTEKKGNFFRIKGNENTFLCEGYATGASIHEATGGTVYVAFDSGNLSHVINAIGKKHSEIILCADNDHKKEENAGLNKAKSACLQYDNVKLAYPVGIEGSDFNDMMIEKGLDAVKNRIAEAKRPDKEDAPKEPPKQNEFILKRASDLEKKIFPEIKWVVPGIIPEGCCLFAGKPKMGKSIFALNIALAITTGAPALGNLTVEKGSALYLSLDDTSERRLQERISTMLQGDDFPENLYYTTAVNRMDKGGLQALEHAIKSIPDLRLVIIDTLQRFRPLDAKKSGNSTLYTEDYNMLSELNDMAIQHNMAILLVTHTRKAEAEDIFDMISGSLGLTAAVDTIMMLTRDSRSGGQPVLSIRGRDVEENQFALSQEKERKMWVINGELRDVQKTESKQKIVDCLKQADEPMSPTEIADYTELKVGHVKKLLVSLMANGIIEKKSRGKYEYIGKKDIFEDDNMGTEKGSKEPEVETPTGPEVKEPEFETPPEPEKKEPEVETPTGPEVKSGYIPEIPKRCELCQNRNDRKCAAFGQVVCEDAIKILCHSNYFKKLAN